MGKEFVIDNLEDMCALMCDNRIPTNIKPDQVKHLADGDWQNGNVTSVRCYNVVPKHVTLTAINEIPPKTWGDGTFCSEEIQRYVEEFIDMGARYAEVNVDGTVDVNNLRRMFQRECDGRFVMYGIRVVKRGDRIFLKRW